MRNYYVYILSNVSKTLYIGFTSNLERRLFEHRQKLVEGFTRQYNVTMLVYFEQTNDVEGALTREKQLKGWSRAKKIALIESMNPEWRDLAKDLLDETSGIPQS